MDYKEVMMLAIEDQMSELWTSLACSFECRQEDDPDSVKKYQEDLSAWCKFTGDESGMIEEYLSSAVSGV